jgi:hypothetical protein
MKKQKIFLASSSELVTDREQFEINISRINKSFVNKGTFLELVIWEDFLDAMSKTRLQDEYNRVIHECDIFVMLFKSKVGKFTKEEFEHAFQQFKETNKPFIFVYFNTSLTDKSSADKEDNSVINFKEKLNELGHFYSTYKNIDELNLKFGRQIEKLAHNGFIKFQPERGYTKWLFFVITALAIVVTISLIINWNRHRLFEKMAEIERIKFEDSMQKVKMREATLQAFQLKYLILEGQEIDLLLDSNKVFSKQMEQVLGFDAQYLETPTIKLLKDLKNQYGIELSKNSFDESYFVGDQLINRHDRIVNHLMNGTILPATNPNLTEEFTAWGFNVNELVDVFGFNRSVIEGLPIDGETYAYKNVIEGKLEGILDLLMEKGFNDQIVYKTLKLYQSIFNEIELPTSFLQMRCIFNECANSWQVSFSTPIIRLKIAYVKNNSEKTMRVNDILIRQNDLKVLVLTTEVDSHINSSFISKKVENNIYLKPGQSVVIPTQILIKPLPIKEFDKEIDLNELPDHSHEYIIGTSIYIDSLKVNGLGFANAAYEISDEFNLFINGRTEGGSCPYLFTYDEDVKMFKMESHILYGQSSKLKEGLDTIACKRFDGRLEIREIDPEVSYIDYVAVLSIDQYGRSTLHFPDDSTLGSVNHSYIKMKQGDVLKLKYSTFKPLKNATYKVISSGYYIVDITRSNVHDDTQSMLADPDN